MLCICSRKTKIKYWFF